MSTNQLTFISGFLGDKEDWAEVIAHLTRNYTFHFACPDNLDLPAEGTLIGYSMGGRIALEIAEEHPKRFPQLILLSTHLGLSSQEERQQRWEHDLEWIQRLETESLEQVLEEWYHQPLFSPGLLEKIKARRLKQDPHLLTALLRRYSLAHQKRYALPENSLYLYGENDTKYKALYAALPQAVAIPNAHHAVHLENPAACAVAIESFLSRKEALQS